MSAHEVTPERIMQLGLGFWGSKAVLTAVELGLFTLLADGPRDAESIRRELGLHSRGVRDFLDSLVALHMLRREGESYANTPETDAYLDRRKPGYVGGILEMANARLYLFWGSLTDALKTGQPQNEASRGQGDLFDELYKDPARLKQFLKSMTGLSLATSRAIAAKFPWKQYKTFVDVGCAQGGLVVEVAKAHSHLTGGGMDLPVVQPVFEEYIESHDLTPRLRFIGGDMFNGSIPGADVLVMGHILHDWGIEKKRELIKKAYNALDKGGAFVIHEALIDDDRSKNAFGLLMSLNMLIETRDGFDFTGADCCGWLKDAGFRETRVEHLAGPDSMVVGIK